MILHLKVVYSDDDGLKIIFPNGDIVCSKKTPERFAFINEKIFGGKLKLKETKKLSEQENEALNPHLKETEKEAVKFVPNGEIKPEEEVHPEKQFKF